MAEYFGKEHADVMVKIRDLQSQLTLENSGVWFMATFVDQKTGFGERKVPAFDMTRDGFTLLAMGFTGKKALQFKLKYIAQFNAMEEQLKNPVQPVAIPTNYAEALRVAADEAEKRMVIASKYYPRAGLMHPWVNPNIPLTKADRYC